MATMNDRSVVAYSGSDRMVLLQIIAIPSGTCQEICSR